MTLDIFGYKDGVPFGRMPKLRLRLFGKRLAAKDARGLRISGGEIFYKLEADKVSIRLSLKLLGNPDFLFTFADASGGEKLSGSGFWRILKVA